MQYTKEKLLKAIKGSFGIKVNIANKLGCSRPTVDNWLKKDEDVRKAYESELENTIDKVENQLIQNISNGDNTALLFFLKCKGRQRGWIDRYDYKVEKETKVTISLEETVKKAKELGLEIPKVLQDRMKTVDSNGSTN
jgi:predicted transcriptional regulator